MTRYPIMVIFTIRKGKMYECIWERKKKRAEDGCYCGKGCEGEEEWLNNIPYIKI